VYERFFDESGGMQLVIHAPFGSRINRAWGLAMRKNFCRTFDFELQAAADDNAINLSLGPQHSFPLEQMFTLLNSKPRRTRWFRRCSPPRCLACAGGGTSHARWRFCVIAAVKRSPRRSSV
jgi:hypothetical protein